MRKFPAESLPLFKKVFLRPDTVTPEDVAAFMRQFAFDEIWIFHGIALEREGKAIVLSGPPGIGKSTLLRNFTRKGMAVPIDDGFVVIGKSGSGYFVVESGLYKTLKPISVISKWLKILSPYKSPYLDPGCPAMDKTIAKGLVLHNIAVLIGSVISKSTRAETVRAAPVRLGKLILVTHHKDPHLPRRIRGDAAEWLKADHIKRIFDAYSIDCEVIHSTDQCLKKILYDRVKKGILIA